MNEKLKEAKEAKKEDKKDIHYMMNMPKWFIEANEDKRIEVVETLLGPGASEPDEEYNKKELDRLLGEV
jgi:hypothetical protein